MEGKTHIRDDGYHFDRYCCEGTATKDDNKHTAMNTFVLWPSQFDHFKIKVSLFVQELELTFNVNFGSEKVTLNLL